MAAEQMRTIPTREGKTEAQHLPIYLGADHPHARGDNYKKLGFTRPVVGPSPRARGKTDETIVDFALTRTIPTREGKTVVVNSIQLSPADHPHARGENYQFFDGALQLLGPSPRARGKLNKQ